MSNKKNHGIKLVGAELRSVRASTAQILEHLERVACVTFEKLDSETLPLGPEGISKIIIKPHNSKWIFYRKNKCAAVYEDPPGICRACNDPDSTDGHAE